MISKDLDLYGETKVHLEKMKIYNPDRRVRERAETILLLDSGLSGVEVAKIQGICTKTVSTTRIAWLKEKFLSLSDKPRSGSPSKLTKIEKDKILSMVEKEPLCGREILAKHLESGGTKVSMDLIIKFLKTNRITWKRTRHSTKQKQCPIAAAKGKVKLDALLEKAKSGEVIVGYFDAAGFSSIHDNRGAWTEIGKQHLIPAIRGKRINVMAAMMSTGELESIDFTGNMTSEDFIEFIEMILSKYSGKIVIVLDNASVHKSNLVKSKLDEWKEKGLELHFLPPYSPELNRIEILWRLMKYSWMAVKHRTEEVLRFDLNEILENFGIKYKFCFYKQ